MVFEDDWVVLHVANRKTNEKNTKPERMCLLARTEHERNAYTHYIDMKPDRQARR